ncbi:hypothetical protein LMH87_011739 [Akanthomyces muscarius]|uniref:Uncharacterized protein n=1 Tax=Akanthomyces muscarius TaxID=2231603 RepID=A0A9W8Q9R9_AKAMU|nr:hypothetical protein LMH87_011739 [Akanthomyces muscarius]KAJ4151019.1 hypothetical protein LMH87_011739 [Akanthomyces muscarius]
MACTTVQRACRHLIPFLLLLLTILQSTLAEQDLNHDALEGVNGFEQLAQFSEEHDAQLRRAYMALMSMFSDATREAATRYGAIELRTLSNELESHIHTVNSNTDKRHRLDLKRSVSDDNDDNGEGGAEGILARLFSSPSPDTESELDIAQTDMEATSTGEQTEPDSGATTLGKRLLGGLLGNILGGDAGKAGGADGAAGAAAGGAGKGGIGGIISNVAGDVVGKLLSSTGSGFAGAGFFGGVGAGQGAAQALNLATAAKAKTTGEQVAQENGMKNSGLNPIISNAAMGLTATAVKAAMNSPLLSKLPPIAALAASLGAGVGSGGAMGLGVTSKNVAPPLNGSSVEDIVGGLGFGASRAFTSNLNLTGGLASLLPPANIGATVQGVGSGIGKGAALGLKLTRNASIEPPPPASLQDIPGVAGSLSFGLSRSFTDSIDVSNIAGLVPGNLDIGASVLSLASGLGGGAAQGLGLAAKNKNLAPPSPKAVSDIPGIAGTLGFGLSNSFTSGADLNAQSLGGLLPNFSFGDAALNVGNGVGKGAALGLKFTNDSSIAPPVPQAAQDIPGLAGTVAFGLSRSFTDALGQKSLANLVPANLDVGGLALSAGTGIGNGAARGLKLTKADLAPALPKSNADLNGIAGTFAFGLSNSLTDNLNLSAQSLGAAIPPIDFNSAALSVGNGIGSGAALGLKLTQKDASGFETPAPPSVPSLADIPKIAGTLAFGVSKSLTGSINGSGMSISNLIPADLDIGEVALGAGRGLGSGASMGLGLASMTMLKSRAESNSSSSNVPGLVEKFTFGLGNSFTDKINISSQAQNLASNLPPVDLGATVLSVGSGLGLGSAKGLGLAKADAQAPPMPESLKDIPQLAGTFSFGLSDALTKNLNITGLLGGLTKNAGGMLAKFAAPVASGLGKGIGTGSAVGLGLQPETDIASPQRSSTQGGDIDAEALAQSFAEGLTSRFLANDTAGKLVKSVSGGNGTGGITDLVGKIDVPRIANGLARGLLTGAGDGVQAVGGINAIINGTSAAPVGPIADTKVEFDDSTGGAVVGFGQGLGASGVVTLQKLLARGINLRRSLQWHNDGDAGDPNTRDLVVARRQENAPSPLNLTRLVSAKALSTVGQKGVDVLTCDGIGGLFLLLSGLQKSGTLPTGDFSENTLDSVRTLIPRDVIRVESQGSTFEVDGSVLADNLGKSDFNLFGTLTINGSPFGRYAAFLAVHIASAIIGLYVVWPLVLTLGSLQNMAIRLRIPLLISAWTPRTTMILRLFVVAPSLIFILVFGLLSGAAAGHFRTAHGILGLITLLVAIAAIALSFFAKPAELTPGDPVSGTAKLGTASWASHACNQVLMALLLPTAFTGFADLSSVTLCLTRAVVTFELAVSLGMGIVFVFALGMYMSSAELTLVFMANRKIKKQKLEEKNRNNENLGGDQGE